MWTCLQILSPLGRISEALADLTKAIQLQPSARLYRHRGTLLFISEVWSSNVRPLCVHTCFDGALGWSCALPSRQDYVTAMEDFQQSLELKKNQPIAMLYKGLTFFHRGMLKVRCSFSIVALFSPSKNIWKFGCVCFDHSKKAEKSDYWNTVYCIVLFLYPSRTQSLTRTSFVLSIPLCYFLWSEWQKAFVDCKRLRLVSSYHSKHFGRLGTFCESHFKPIQLFQKTPVIHGGNNKKKHTHYLFTRCGMNVCGKS